VLSRHDFLIKLKVCFGNKTFFLPSEKRKSKEIIESS